MIIFSFLLPYFFSPFCKLERRTNTIRNFLIPKPFTFPNGNRPNISDPTTYENFTDINETEYFIMMDELILYSLMNTSNDEISYSFTNPNVTQWEVMMKFGGPE